MLLTKPLSLLPKLGGERENSLDDYLARGYPSIEGWLLEPALQLTLALAKIQSARMPAGPVCEIGVWQGRYLSLLSFVSATPMPVVGVDMFTHVADRDVQMSRLFKNINAWCRRPKLVRIIQKNSRDVTADELLKAGGGKFQFVSVDGDHTRVGCLNDLRLASAITAPGGIVAVDSAMNATCPGVIEAVVLHSQEATSTLAPLAIVGNKLFMTQPEHCAAYRQALLEVCQGPSLGQAGRSILDFDAQMQSLQIGVELLGQKILVLP
jgi:hypothetical protein